MTRFYRPEEKVYHNDGREEALLDFITSHPDHAMMKNSPERIIAAIDQYGREEAFLMNVGNEKGKIVSEVIANVKPNTIIELGGYVGYSAIQFGNELKKAGGSKYISLEVHPGFAKVSTALIKLAGLDDIVEVRVGACRDSLRELSKTHAGKGGLDMLFIDHAKVHYTNDLKLCEELGLVAKGTTLVADNVSRNPEYLEYVRSSNAKKQEAADEAKQSSLCSEGDYSIGKPDLKYESSIIHSIEPTGEPDAVDISQCLGDK